MSACRHFVRFGPREGERPGNFAPIAVIPKLGWSINRMLGQESRLQNETKKHFETRDLHGDAKRAQEHAYKAVSKEEAKKAVRARWMLYAALVLTVVFLVWVLGGS